MTKLVARVFAEQKSKKYVHVASLVGEIQLKVYCNPRPYHDKTGLYMQVRSGSEERGGR
jgi:hypothetical protein